MLPIDGGRLRAAIRIRRPASKFRLSAKGLEFIARFEGFRSHPYNDAAGYATVGYGHLLRYGPVRPSDLPISVREAVALLRKDVHKSADAVRALPVKLKQHEFDALVSAVFNLGPGVLDKGRSLGDAVRSGKFRRVPAALKLYDKAGGRVLAGLLARRTAEGRMFATGRYR
jgi:GH24 family phage-related lysozyme (muramidase)